MEALNIDQVTRRFRKRQQPAVDRLSLSVGKQEILAVVGESGSGKSTLLRLIAGLETPDSGRVEIFGNTVADGNTWVPTEKRQVGFVFQDGALFPHLTIGKNIRYGIRRDQQADQVVKQSLDLVGLSNFENRYPAELSGGERQRVALARALAPEPKLLLLDEPFSNLDPSLRRDMREEISDILRRVGASAIMVTHDTEDALIVGDRIAIVRSGKVEQLGTPTEIYQHPVNAYCAQLFGPAFAIGDRIFRPDQVELVAQQKDGSVEVSVKRIQQLGGSFEAIVEPSDPTIGSRWIVQLSDSGEWRAGDQGWVRPKSFAPATVL